MEWALGILSATGLGLAAWFFRQLTRQIAETRLTDAKNTQLEAALQSAQLDWVKIQSRLERARSDHGAEIESLNGEIIALKASLETKEAEIRDLEAKKTILPNLIKIGEEIYQLSDGDLLKVGERKTRIVESKDPHPEAPSYP